MYIELDHNLVAGKLKNINEKTVLEGREEVKGVGWFEPDRYLLNKYNISKLPVKDVLLKKGLQTEETSGESFQKRMGRKLKTDTSKDDKEKQVRKKEEEVVIGSDGEVFFDHDFGFFGAVLACYNNHWVLKTTPDDWWNVIVRWDLIFISLFLCHHDMRQLQMFQKVESGGGPIFKVVLEC